MNAAKDSMKDAAPDGQTMVDQAYERMRRLILDNVWPPGQQLLEQEIALQLLL